MFWKEKNNQSSVPSKLSQMEGILESAHNGVLAIDSEGKVIYINRAAEIILRCEKETSTGKHLSEVVVPLDLLKVLETGKPQLAQKVTLGRQKRKRHFMTNRTPIFDSGQVVGAVAVFQDISEIEAISYEMSVVKQLNKELETVIGASYDCILVMDRNGKIIRANGENGRLAKLLTDDLVKKISEDIIPRIIKESKRISDIIETENRLLAVTANPVYNGLDVEKVVINVRDLTELNNLKRALEETKQLSKRYLTELSSLNKQYMRDNGIIVNSKSMEHAVSLALRVADVDATVLILGESGSGKQVIANIIHHVSKRVEYPLVQVNCGAIPENLLETELFGYSPGAFTGACKTGKAGLFELADKGTIFLDEIGELPIHLQVKILHAIQEKIISRVGSNQSRKIDVRIIAATHRNLEEMVKKGEFREDLYFRLNVVPLRIPPLRDRREDIIPLIKSFLDRYNKRYNLVKEISPITMEYLLDYIWPGNVRELENMIERLVVTAPGNVITQEELPLQFVQKRLPGSSITVKGIVPLKDAVMEVERQMIFQAIEHYGSTYKAAKALNIDQSTLVRKINRLKKGEEADRHLTIINS
ncbi:MAG: sigma 54-interacting transcriptional regulator [Bacillota bacterium]